MTNLNHLHTRTIEYAGKAIKDASKVLIMIHGRGGNARDILSLADRLDVQDYALLAPQASNNTWYHYSFMASPQKNEPWLSSAINILKETVDDVIAQGIPAENIFFLGFSQGACLTLEYSTRNAQRFGGIVAFTGGLIGDKIYSENYKGNFSGTPIFIGTGDLDPHVPLERVNETENILLGMDAKVTKKVYPNKPHSISNEELDFANSLIFMS